MPLLLSALILFPITPIPDQVLGEWGQKVSENGGLSPVLVTEYRQIQDLLNPPEPVYLPPQPRTSPPPPPASYTAGVEQWRNLIATYFDPANIPWAMRVMTCESGGNPSAQNSRSSAGGLFQFIDSTWASTPYAHVSKYDPEANIAAAAWLLEDATWGGPQHWVCK